MCICIFISIEKQTVQTQCLFLRNLGCSGPSYPLWFLGVLFLFFPILFCASEEEEQRPTLGAVTFLLRTSVLCCVSGGVTGTVSKPD